MANPSDDFGTTPGRTTLLTLDVDDRILQEVGFNCTRTGAEIAKTVSEGVTPVQATSSMRYWSSGCYSLTPVQYDISSVNEQAAAQQYVLTASDFSLQNLAGSMGGGYVAVAQHYNFAQSSLVGAGYGPGVASTADPFLVRSWPAGASLDPSQVASNATLLNADIPAVPLAGLSSSVPMDRIAGGISFYPPDQGYFLRWSAPGDYHSYPLYCWGFGFANFYIAFTGDGKAILWEFCPPSPQASPRWVQRATFRYAASKRVMGTSHTLTIWPHVGPGGEKLIAFAGGQPDTAQPTGTLTPQDASSVAATEFIYRGGTLLRGSDPDPSPGHSTAGGYCWVESRRDVRLSFQVSRLAFEPAGVLTDFAHSVGTQVANTNPVTISVSSTRPPGTRLTPAVLDSTTNTAFVPGTDSQPYAAFEFTTDDSTYTPVLYAYRMKQNELINIVSPGSFSLFASDESQDLESVEITGFTGDPADESAELDGYDLTDSHTRLNKRGRLSASLTITDPAFGTVPIFRGYAVSPRSELVGPNIPAGFSGTGAVPTFPVPGWRRYFLHLEGQYLRLAEKVTPSFGQFGVDDGAPTDPTTGSQPPWKVTDAIRILLLYCGYDSEQVDIPDLPLRMWVGHTLTILDQLIQPGADIAEVLVRMCRNYYGCYLYFCPQTGSYGKWQLLFAPVPTTGQYAPLYDFVTTAPTGRVPSFPGSYAPTSGVPTSFINGSPDFVVEPPDFNAVIVSTDTTLTTPGTRLRHVAYCYNYLSFNVPKATVSADPDHPDYIGHMVPYEIVDPSLQGANDQETWQNVAWTARRAYDYYCHSRSVAHFTAPYVLINDASLGVPRPLRFLDPIAIDGDASYLIKSMTIRYTKSHVMMCDYEAIAPIAGQYFVGADGKRQRKESLKTLTRKTMGHATRSNHWGLMSVSAADERRRLDLPLNNVYQAPLQDSTGQFYQMPDYDLPDSPQQIN